MRSMKGYGWVGYGLGLQSKWGRRLRSERPRGEILGDRSRVFWLWFVLARFLRWIAVGVDTATYQVQ